MVRPMGPVSATKATFNAGKNVSNLPMTTRTGPMAAATPAMMAMNVCVPSLKLLNHVSNDSMAPSTALTAGSKASPKRIAMF